MAAYGAYSYLAGGALVVAVVGVILSVIEAASEDQNRGEHQ
jgi:hypothetical protein